MLQNYNESITHFLPHCNFKVTEEHLSKVCHPATSHFPSSLLN